MDWITIIGLLLFGTLLLVAETVFVPGTTIVGILGFLFSGYAIYLGYDYFGITTGTYILVSAAVVNLGAIIYSFKSKSWERFSLKNTMEGSVKTQHLNNVKTGDEGTTLSSLKPIGKALFHELEIEVQSNGGLFIEENTAVEIVRIASSKIFVQPINN